MTNHDMVGPKRSASFTEVERSELLARMRRSGLHYADFADQEGISRCTFRNWLRFEHVTPTEKAEWRHRGPYSAIERRKTVDAFYRSGMTQANFAATWGVGSSTLSGWIGRYNEGGFEALDQYQKPKAGDQRRGSKVPAVVRREIIAVKTREPWFGLKKIKDWLSRFRGIKVSTGTIRKTIVAEGLALATPKRKRRRSADKIRRFERARPMQLWQSDITSFLLKRHSTRVYLTVFMDDHSRYVVSWKLQTRQSADLVLESFKEGVSKFGKPEEVLTDQGRQYFAWRGKSEFETLLEREGIKHVVSRAHHPETLGKCERFWKTVEAEFWTRTRPDDLDEAKLRFKYFIDHYNHQRPHQGLNGASPADKFFGVADEVRLAIEKTIDENSLRFAVGDLPKPPAFLIGQIGDQRISFHGSSGGFFLTQDKFNGDNNEQRKTFDRIIDRNAGTASDDIEKEARPGLEADDMGREAPSQVSRGPGAWLMGSGVGGGEVACARKVGDSDGVLGRTDIFGRSKGETWDDSVAFLADESAGSGGLDGWPADAASHANRRTDGEAESRGRSEETKGEDPRA